MFKLLIVDDEPLARKHIRTSFPWKHWGFDIIGEAANGEEALKLCESSVPDVALIDITMPVMDGLALLTAFQHKYPRLQSIILTAHRDFEYARRAIKQGAAGYILKSPVDVKETKAALDQACQELRKWDMLEQKEDVHLHLLQTYRYPMRSKWFEDVVNDSLPFKEDLVKSAESIGVKLEADFYVLLVLTVERFPGVSAFPPPHLAAVNEWGVAEIADKVLSEHFAAGYELFPAPGNPSNRCAILLKASVASALDHNEAIYDFTVQLIDSMLQPLLNDADMQFSIAASERFSSIRQLKDKYTQLIGCHGYRYYQRKPEPIMPGQVVPFHPSLPVEYERLHSQFHDITASEEASRLKAWLRLVRHVSLRYKPEPNRLRQWFSDLVSKETDFTDWPAFQQSPDLFDSLNVVGRCVTEWWELQRITVQMRPEVAKAIHYIKQHLQDELSLHTLSQVTQISPTYLSRLFKKDIGLSIIDYISEQRINQAKQYFMEGSYRNHELAEMVGFHNYSYFCTMFKKMTGMTPNEYKNSVRTIR